MNGFLAITYAFMLAYCPYHDISVDGYTEFRNNPTHASFEIGLELFDCVNVYTGAETYQFACKLTDWQPYTQSYWIGAEYNKTFGEKFNLSVGYKHKCQHPVECWKIQPSTYNYCCSELYVGIEGKVDIF